MPLRTLIPIAVFAAFAFFASRRPRPWAGRFQGLSALLFVASLAALTWWAFGTFELFPAVFGLVYSLVTWGTRPLADPTPWDRAILSRWSPLAVAVLLVGAGWAGTKRFDALPLGFALLPFVPFPFDRSAVARFLSSAWALLALGVALAAMEWGLLSTFDPEMWLGFALIGVVALAPPARLRFAPEDRKLVFHPAIYGLLTAAAVAWTWGSLDPVPAVHDEASYLFQARLFAHGQWRAPSPPLPEFFEQLHVLVTPVMASKYPPGHALLLATAIRTGSPAIVPIVLTGFTAGLFFELARRLSNSAVALLAWLIWIGASRNLEYRATYLSEITTSALWLAGWWVLLRWKETGKSRYLALLGACVAWGAITRPLTMLAFAIPAVIVVLRLVVTRRAWRDLALAAVPGAAILSILPVLNHATTGDWRVSPLQLYTRQYMPYDVPGFGPGAPPPARELSADLRRVNELFERRKNLHLASDLPRILVARATAIKEDLFGRNGDIFLVFLAIGLFHAAPAAALAFGTGVLLVVLYLTYWHVHNWSVYYLELYPAVCFVAALGVWRLITIAADILSRRRANAPDAAVLLTLRAGASFAVILAVSAAVRIPTVRSEVEEKLEAQGRFRRTIRQIRAPAIVFVRYGASHDIHRSLVQAEDDLTRVRVWVAHDRGDENERLLRLFPDRRPYLYDEAHRSLRPLAGPTRSAPGG